MTRSLGTLVMVGVSLAVIFGSAAALAQKQGGILRVHALDSPPSLSMHEEADAVPARATMGLFNNLVMCDQHAKQNNMQSIVPDLATGWSWSEDGTELTFPLREGVKWHDSKPFTAEDVKCTWDLLTGKPSQRLRPRKSWYHNLAEVTTNGDFEVTFHLGGRLLDQFWGRRLDDNHDIRLREGPHGHCQLNGLRAPFCDPGRLERGSTIGEQRTFRPEPPRHRHQRAYHGRLS